MHLFQFLPHCAISISSERISVESKSGRGIFKIWRHFAGKFLRELQQPHHQVTDAAQTGCNSFSQIGIHLQSKLVSHLCM